MRPTFFLTAALALLPLAARADMKTIELKHLTPATLAGMLADEKTLLLPDGIDSITLEPKKKSVMFTGTREGLEQVGVLLKLLDKPARIVNLSLKLVRGGKVVATPSVRAVNNKRTLLQSPGVYNLELIAHANGDGTISLQLETATEKSFKRLAPGKPESFAFKYTTIAVTATVEKPR